VSAPVQAPVPNDSSRAASGHRSPVARRGDWAYTRVVAPAVAWAVRLLAWMLRLRVISGRDHLDAAMKTSQPVIFVFWHENLFAIAALYLRVNITLRRASKRAAVMISQSRDGQKLVEIIQRLGLEPIRGSSSRGAVGALIEIAHWLKRTDEGGRGRFAALALDGPRGPRHVAKPGVALLAHRVGALIVPVSFRFSRQWVFKSWDRTRLAKPWAIMECSVGAPVEASAWDGLEPEAQARQLEAEMAKLPGMDEAGEIK
jgi:lysophospholipid acyltransferase (LPLAT)-like uncharacterized protein